MLPLYKGLISQKILQTDKINVEEMEKENKQTLQDLEDKIKDAEENFGENEVREALLNRCLFYKRIGEKELAKESYAQTLKKTVALGQKIDIAFDLIRTGFAFNDLQLLKTNIERAKQ
jgi:26S proteasome regulatory subunit N7